MDMLIFLGASLESLPHDPDVKALVRMAAVCKLPTARNRVCADLISMSPLMSQPYESPIPNYDAYQARRLEAGFRPPALSYDGDNVE